MKAIALLVEHARPYAVFNTRAVRPPIEETMHEHWKNSARLAPSDRKYRSNCIAHTENNFASLQRLGLLQECLIPVQGEKYVGSYEASQFPILFINTETDSETCVNALIDNCSSMPELQKDISNAFDEYRSNPPISDDLGHNTPVLYILRVFSRDATPINVGKIIAGRKGLIVSNTELLKIHAYTMCMLAILLPTGIKLEMVCMPSRHIEILAKISVHPLPKTRPYASTPLTVLGANETQVTELSQALSKKLSLEPDKSNTSREEIAEAMPNVSQPVPNLGEESFPSHIDEHVLKSACVSPGGPSRVSGATSPADSGGKKFSAGNCEHDINVQGLPPADLGGKEPLHSKQDCVEIASEKDDATSTVTWTFDQDVVHSPALSTAGESAVVDDPPYGGDEDHCFKNNEVPHNARKNSSLAVAGNQNDAVLPSLEQQYFIKPSTLDSRAENGNSINEHNKYIGKDFSLDNQTPEIPKTLVEQPMLDSLAVKCTSEGHAPKKKASETGGVNTVGKPALVVCQLNRLPLMCLNLILHLWM